MKPAVFALGIALVACGAAAPAPIRSGGTLDSSSPVDGYAEAVAELRAVQAHVAQLAPKQNGGFFRYSEPISELEVEHLFDYIAKFEPAAIGPNVPTIARRGPELSRAEHIRAMHEELTRAVAAVRDRTPGPSAEPTAKAGILNALTSMESEVVADHAQPDYAAAGAELREAFAYASDAIIARELRDDTARRVLRAAMLENDRNGGGEDENIDQFGLPQKPLQSPSREAAVRLFRVIAILAKPETDPTMARTRDETLAHVAAALRIVDPSSAIGRRARSR